MAEESLANKNEPPSDASDAEYDRIFTTLSETETGRRFLEEYARRSRPIEVEASLATIERMQAVIRAGGASERLRLLNEIVEMAEAITRVRAEIMAIKPPRGAMETTEVLDSIVRTTEQATSNILAATEQMQEAAWALRDAAANQNLCDRLDALATDIYTACTFQDLTGQRTRKVIDVLRHLETRINTIIGASERTAAEIAALEKAELAQADIDAMLAPEPPQEERQEASLEDISRFMQALEPMMIPHPGSNGELRASEPASEPTPTVAVDDVRPELSVADAIVAETVEARATAEWDVNPAPATPPQPVAQEGAAEWVVNDASPLPEAEPDWMILRRIEMELDAQVEAEEPAARDSAQDTAPHGLLPPAELNSPGSRQPSAPFHERQTRQESQSAIPGENAPSSPPRESKGKEDSDDFLFDPPGWGPARNQMQGADSEPGCGTLPDPTLPQPQQAESSGTESSRPRASYDPLAPIRAMSDEQKIALFS